ncbi:MAG: hypothetical protein ACC707_20835 [Thiohalomonadales bacterium]
MTSTETTTEFGTIFDTLRLLLLPYAEELDCREDISGKIYINTHYLMKNQKPVFFASVEIRKNYVSYHLMPMYVNPDLVTNISAELSKRIQGKSCFNFQETDNVLFAELRQLTTDGYHYYVECGYI